MKRYIDLIDERLTARYKKCMKFCGDLKDKKILNIGCYNGWFEKFAVENGCSEVIGIDTDENNLQKARLQVKDGKVKFLKASALNLSQFVANYFDVVTIFDVIEHLPKGTEEKALTEIKRVLTKNGILVISTPNKSFLSNILDPAWYFGHRHYSKTELENILLKNSFEIEKTECRGGYYELLSMILLYFFKWILRREIPFKGWFEEKRDEEYLKKDGFVTLFVRAIK